VVDVWGGAAESAVVEELARINDFTLQLNAEDFYRSREERLNAIGALRRADKKERNLMRFIQSLAGVLLLLPLVSCGSAQAPGSILPGRPATKELMKLVAEARTKADHQALAAHFHQEAEELRTKQKEHEDLGFNYLHSRGVKFDPSTAEHCMKMASGYALVAANADELARTHEEMAKNSPDQ
jgi:hypothetical protein